MSVRVGFDFLGLGHNKWPFKATLSILPPNSLVGFFWDTFGPTEKKAEQLLKSGHDIRVHLWWANSHVIAPLDHVKRGARVFQTLATKYPARTIYLSHSCEYNEPNAAKVQARVDILKQLASACVPINARWRGATIPGVVTEIHGFVAANSHQAASTDGAERSPGRVVSCYDMDVEKWIEGNHKARYAMLWGLRCNLREVTKAGQKIPPPKERTAVPSKEYLASIVRLANPSNLSGYAEPKPGAAKKIVKPELYKSHAEDEHGKEDPRENRPVLIVKPKAPFAEVLAANGKTVGKLMYGSAFEGGLHTYRAGTKNSLNLYGYQIGARAKKLSGIELVWFRVGKVLYGPVNPAFRAGYYP